MIIGRRYTAKQAQRIAQRMRGRAYRKRKGIKTCHCDGWWFPHRAGSEPKEPLWGHDR